MILLTLKFKTEDIVENSESDKFSIKIFLRQKQYFLKIKKLFQKLNLKDIVVKDAILKPKDWAILWKAQWKPAMLTKELDVVPLWCLKAYPKIKGRDFIILDSIVSFGTGLHETTQIVSQMIEDQHAKIENFLDIGTGTGILSMVALKYHIKNIVAIDIEDLSIDAAQSNFKINGYKATVIKSDIMTFKPSINFDFVAANLITHDLILGKHAIIKMMCPGGYLAVSGVSLENCPIFEDKFKDSTLKRVQKVKAKEWAGYLFQKMM